MNHGKRVIRVHGGALHYDDGAGHTATEVFESDRDTFTGLYDQDGTPLHRMREPIGYQHDRWSNHMAAKPDQKKTYKTKKKGK